MVLLLETMLAFPDKDALADEVVRVLEPGGRFAFTVGEGRQLTKQERALMPGADMVWPIQLAKLTGALREAGLTATWQWSGWLGSGRVRKFATAAKKQ